LAQRPVLPVNEPEKRRVRATQGRVSRPKLTILYRIFKFSRSETIHVFM
jgi:hypothetical protein